jgi:WD40 repeat protein
LIATAGLDNSVGIWDARKGTLLTELKEHQGPVRDVAFNRDGKFLLSISDDGKVRLWDTSTWMTVSYLVPKEPPAASVALTADNRYVLLAEADRRVRIYPWERIAPLPTLLEIAKLRLKRQLSPEERALYLPGFQAQGPQ